MDEYLTLYAERDDQAEKFNVKNHPEHGNKMDEQTLKDYEAAFYQEQLGRDKGAKIIDLKRQYSAFRAASLRFRDVAARFRRRGVGGRAPSMPTTSWERAENRNTAS